ncbi:MAG: hypothetical protein KDD41_01065 [Flavobacteriales bacterium]|nr:hypothetical protein [Flavobacteriales bacterium]
MKPTNLPKKICFIGNSDHSYLLEYIHLNRSDQHLSFSFKTLDLNALLDFAPDIIVVDLYFCDQQYLKVADLIENAFPNTHVYILSPEFADFEGLMISTNNPVHFLSNLSVDILNHINGRSSGNSYLEAG